MKRHGEGGKHKFTAWQGAVLLVLTLSLSTMPAAADDRDLVRSSGGTPWVYLLLDSSGSMDEHADPAHKVYWYEDSPTSKAYLAKKTIYEIVEDLDDSVKIGFNTFGQKNIRAWQKSWGYVADMTEAERKALPWWSYLEWPTHWTINGGDRRESDTYDSCDNPTPPNGGGSGGPGRVVERYGFWDFVSGLDSANKWSPAGTEITKVAVRNYSFATTYLVTFHPPGDHLDNVMAWEGKVEVMNCNTLVTDVATIKYKPAFATDLDGTPLPSTAYVSSMSSEDEDDPDDDPNCQSGWRENDEEQTKPGALGYPVFPDPAGRSDIFDRGHNLPWDWKSFPDTTPGYKYSNRQELMRRLAPNVFASGTYDPSVQPDFRIGPYLEDYVNDYYHVEKPGVAETPPFGFTTLTPLGRSLTRFKDWHAQWKTAADLDLGAGAFDCSPRYAILVTDGVDTCENDDPAEVAADLLDAGVRTFVIGYGDIEDENNSLQAIADAGGTGKGDTLQPGIEDCTHFSYTVPDPSDPAKVITGDVCDVVARDTEALKNSLEAILKTLSSSRSSFAGAATPSGQVEAEDVIYIPSFLPIADRAEWKGSLAMFRRPLPFTNDTPPVPDFSEVCIDDPMADPPTACLAWDAAESMKGQAASATDIAGGDFRIGYDESQRRVLWNRSQDMIYRTPRQLALLEPTQDNEPFPLLARYKLWSALGLTHNPFDTSDDAPTDATAREILGNVLVTKTGTDSTGGTHEFILGDIFHSQPLHVGPPTRYDYMSANLYGSGDCWNGTTFNSSNKGYRCYWMRNKWRRHVAFVGSNDGQLHAFDAGRVRHNNADSEFDPHMTTGTGKELFAFVPTEIMRKYEDRYDGVLEHQWGVDGNLVQDDVFVVPSWNGMTAINPNNREWRTLVIGSMRRGGRGYFALDVTTPDPVTPDATTGEVLPPDVATQGYVPGCLENQPSGCDSLPYPALRWEFRDHAAGGGPADSDGNGHRDLGYSWSTPVTGRVHLGTDGSGNEIYRFVAIFGGGMDENNAGVGNFIYMVDIETGKVLYKEAVTAAVPSKVAAVDVNRDAVLDLVYFGDVDGHLYKIDMTEDATLDADGKINDVDWKPFEIFDAEGRPFYHPPTLIWSAQNNSHAVAIGSGNREDLWAPATATQALFVFMDPGWDNSLAAPFKQADLHLLGTDPETDAILTEPPGLATLSGYALEFASNERMISQVFALSGFLTFTTYNPKVTVSNVTGCGASGTSNLYTIRATNGNPLVTGSERYRSVSGYVSNPFSAPSPSNGPTNGTTPDGTTNPPENFDDVIDYLKSQMPENCRFTNKRIDIKAVRSDTGMEWLAPVPVCVRRSNWKQF